MYTCYRIIAVILLTLGLSACSQQVVSDGGNTFTAPNNLQVPYDRSVYTIRGTVVSDVHSMSRQVSAGETHVSTYPYVSGGGSFFSETTGKGFVRVKIDHLSSSITPPRADIDTAVGRVGDTVLLKTTDSKAQGLLPGDVVAFKCRVDFEMLGSVTAGEALKQEDVTVLGTWEFDLCRMSTAVIGQD